MLLDYCLRAMDCIGLVLLFVVLLRLVIWRAR